MECLLKLDQGFATRGFVAKSIARVQNLYRHHSFSVVIFGPKFSKRFYAKLTMPKVSQNFQMNKRSRPPPMADRTPENFDFFYLRALTATMTVRMVPPVLPRFLKNSNFSNVARNSLLWSQNIVRKSVKKNKTE